MACPHPLCDRTVWRAAIALNNIGWTLLDKECYDQAHQTLKDAAHVMVAIIHGDSSGHETRQSVESRLRAANQRLASTYSAACPSWPGPQRGREGCPEPLRVDVDEFVVDTLSPDFVAIAGHNCAVSHFYQSMLVAHAPDAQRHHLAAAVSLLRWSYSIISEVCGSAPATLAHALHILENLRTVARWCVSASGTSAAPAGERPEQAGGTRALFLLELDAELSQLRALVHELEAVDVALFGRPVKYAGAA
jgi:hypothetical protein